MQKLRPLLQSLHHYFQSLTSLSLRREEEGARVRIVAALAQLPHDVSEDAETSTSCAQVAASIGEWLIEYLEYVVTSHCL